MLNVGFKVKLETAVDIAWSHELSQAQIKTIASGVTDPHKQTLHTATVHETCKCAENATQQSQANA